MGKFSDYFSRRSSDRGEEDSNYDYYEDTHNENGDYTARLRNFQRESSQNTFSARSDNYSSEGGARFSAFSSENSNRSQPQQQLRQDGGKNFQNFMVYEPRTADDVQTLIDFLKTRESAIINLDNVDEEVSQRVLDFVSGAIYALNGSVHRVAGNIFLLSSEGVGITNSYEMKNNAKKQ